MADNVTLNSGTGGQVLATDDIGAVQYQRIKLIEGADGVNDGDVSQTNPLPVEQRNLPFNRTASGALGALNAAVTVSAEGAGLVHWEIDTGTLVGTVVFEATLDDTNWFAINALTIAGAIIASVSAFAARGALDGAGYSQVRLRVSAFTSGTSNARAEASAGSGLMRLAQALPAGANNIGDVDVVSSVLPTGAATSALQTQPGVDIGDVTVNNAAGASAVNVQDGGNSLTIDGSVSIAGAVDTELPAAAALADAAANPTTPTIGGANLIFNGTTWDRARGDTANGLDVDVTRLPALVAGTANIGDVDVLTLPALPAGTNNIGDVDVLSGPTGASALQGQGTAAHDAAVVGNPATIAARANANEPAAVADGDTTHLWADLLGRLVVLPGHPSPEAPVALNATASGNTTVIAAPGASLSLHICKGVLINGGAANVVVLLQDGAAGTTRFRAELASEGGGVVFDFGARGWKLTANTLLNVNLGAAGDVSVNVTEYYIAA